ncbi:calcium-binding protein [Catellatospora sp. TT07R-123]|uniref:calcium-binding protein n=1 Tax=Catellatospora sp. TT07R-123 TaxID=2733863 RepID=UPI001BB44B47|nr:calcium-binding protein [Catellatospora sp. TT07R-123]
MTARSVLGGAAAVTAVVLATAAPAYAAVDGRARLSGTTLIFQAGSGVANTVTVTPVPGGLRVDDAWPIIPGPGCAAITATAVLCAGKPTDLSMKTYDGNDTVTDGTALPAFIGAGDGDDLVYALSGGPKLIYGEYGDDALLAGPGSDKLYGQDGADQLYAGDGADYLSGGDGIDYLEGDGGTDIMEGGAGYDTASYRIHAAAVTASLDGVGNDGAPGENDIIAADVEGLQGGYGDDTLTGNAADNSLDGGDGADLLDGLGGADNMFGGDGPDTLLGGDGADWLDGGAGFDTIDGGPGPDTCVPGADGAVLTGCP